MKDWKCHYIELFCFGCSFDFFLLATKKQHMQHATNIHWLSLGGLKKNSACKPWTRHDWMSPDQGNSESFRGTNLSHPKGGTFEDDFSFSRLVEYASSLQFVGFGIKINYIVSCFIFVGVASSSQDLPNKICFN